MAKKKKKNTSFFSELKRRVKSQTPLFFKRIRNVSASLAAICGALVLAYNQLPPEFVSVIPEWILKAITFTTLGSAGVSQLTKIDSVWEEEDKNDK